MTREQIYDMLREVLHPGKGDRNIVELGMVNGIAIEEDLRGTGLGSLLLNKGLEETSNRGGERMFLVARAPEFFRRNGFVTVPREEAPNFFECLTCPQYGVSCHPEVMRIDL